MTQLAASLDRHQVAAEVKNFARRLGFDLCGIASAEPSHYRRYFQEWLDRGAAGEMEYLKRRIDERADPTVYLPGAKTVVCVATNYHVPLEPPSPDIGSPARVARYALGQDYHEHIKHKLYDLADWLRDTVPGSRTRCGVDTAPVMEKELAARAGVGWIGKNTCVINPDIGSWILLAEVITTIDLPTDDPAVDRCGSCTRCIDACPTQAIIAPYQLDARRCISYLTIEHAGPIDPDLKSQMSDWLWGCDVCQDVCPYNKQPPTATNPTLQPRFRTGIVDAAEVLRWDDQTYYATLRRSAMRRVKLPVLKRNAQIVAENLSST